MAARHKSSPGRGRVPKMSDIAYVVISQEGCFIEVSLESMCELVCV